MNGRLMFYVDQYGDYYWTTTVRELRDKVRSRGYGSKVSRMYVDTSDGRRLHIGYVVGQRWCRAYIPYEREE
jgi:hypothetical protein